MNSRRSALVAVFFIAQKMGTTIQDSRTEGTAIAQLVAVLVLCGVCAVIMGRNRA